MKYVYFYQMHTDKGLAAGILHSIGKIKNNTDLVHTCSEVAKELRELGYFVEPSTAFSSLSFLHEVPYETA